ncbi:caspase family protein [Candidatus Parabeggiatoa sp. HSG14]|uniref:caspase family protein n=1 Tax=Candidatus Parabeggiatoa sp. HSG14 TaxID=3055593 RepID=UPI0025A6A28A|nr:caspase family protein [Thiotrichales bacterium HSG14]
MKKLNIIFLATLFLLLSSCTPSKVQDFGEFSTSKNNEELRGSELETVSTTKRRLALLIGNQGYKKGRLDNPHNDVDDMETVLEAVGFKVRKLKDQQSLDEMEDTIKGFGESLAQDKNTVGLFYFSGHGMQYQRKNFLFPIGAMASVTMPEHLRIKTLDVEYLLATMEGAGNRLNLIFLDACRDNPFTWDKGSGLKQGLATMQAPSGSLIAYATQADHFAKNSKGQRNSPYTQHLKQEILKPNISIFEMLTNVRVAVKRETNGSQEPAFYSGLDGKFCFKGCGQEEARQQGLAKERQQRLAEKAKQRRLAEERQLAEQQQLAEKARQQHLKKLTCDHVALTPTYAQLLARIAKQLGGDCEKAESFIAHVDGFARDLQNNFEKIASHEIPNYLKENLIEDTVDNYFESPISIVQTSTLNSPNIRNVAVKRYLTELAKLSQSKRVKFIFDKNYFNMGNIEYEYKNGTNIYSFKVDMWAMFLECTDSTSCYQKHHKKGFYMELQKNRMRVLSISLEKIVTEEDYKKFPWSG